MIKRLLIGLICWLLGAQMVLATPATVNLGSANNTAANSNVVITLPNGLAAGSTIIVAMLHTSTGTTCGLGVTSWTDTAGNNYGTSPVVQSPNNSSANGELCVWRVFNSLALSSGNTLTATTVQGFATVIAVGITGVLASPLDVAANSGGASGFCTLSGGTGITPTTNGDMLIGICGWVNAGATTSDFTQDTTVAWASPPVVNAYTANGVGIGGGSFVQATAANIDYEPGAIGPIAEYMIALKPAGAGAGAVPQRSRRGYGN